MLSLKQVLSYFEEGVGGGGEEIAVSDNFYCSILVILICDILRTWGHAVF